MEWKERLLILFIIIFPFNLIIGRIIPETVFLPLYIIDILLLLVGIFVFIDWKKIEGIQKWMAIGFALFLFWGSASIIFHWHEIMIELSIKDATYEIFKKILSDNVLHIFNKLFHLCLAFILFLAILQTQMKKEKLLKYMCIPLAIIVVMNVFLVLAQQNVKLDGGKPGTLIIPYGITEVGRAYFPFVNSSLLSLYLSISFFIVLYLFLNAKEHQRKIMYGIFLFALLLTLDFTKGRAALACILFLYTGLVGYLLIRRIPLPKKMLLATGIFLIVLNLHIFIFHNFTILATVNDFFEKQENNSVFQQINAAENTASAPEAVAETKEQERIILEQLNRTSLQITNQYSEFHRRRRTYHWPTALALFKEHLFIGVGTGLFFYSVVDNEKDVLCENDMLCPDKQQPTDISSTAHSIYLQILAENGIIGLILFIVLLGVIIVYGLRTCLNQEVIFVIAVICFLVQGALFSYFEYLEMVYLFWLLVGIMVKKE